MILCQSFYSFSDGTMCTLDSAEAPEFFFHHGFIDKIWHDWQKKSLANKNAYFLQTNIKMQATTYYPRDFIDILKQPGCVKVCYAEPTVHSAKSVRRFLKSKPRFSRTSFWYLVPRCVLDRTSISDEHRFKRFQATSRY